VKVVGSTADSGSVAVLKATQGGLRTLPPSCTWLCARSLGTWPCRNALVPTGVFPRTHTQVSALFDGLPLAPPGVVPVTEWRPEATSPAPPADLYAGIARIPPRR
jgi:hypothetical protein